MPVYISPQTNMAILRGLHKINPIILKSVIAVIIFLQTAGLFLQFKIDVTPKYYLSIENIHLNVQLTLYLIGFASYLLSLIFLIPKNLLINRISAILFFTGWTITFATGLIFINKVPDNQINDAIWSIGIFTWIFLPLLPMLFYIPLCSAKDSLHKTEKEYQKRRRYMRNVSRWDMYKPLIFCGVSILVLSGVLMFIDQKISCIGLTECVVRGTWFDQSAVFLLATGALIGNLVLVYWPGKGVFYWEKSMFKWFLPFSIIIFVWLVYVGLNTGVTTSTTGIIVKDTSGWIPKTKLNYLMWNQIKSFRVDSYLDSDNNCSYQLYLYTGSNKEIDVPTDFSGDRDLWQLFIDRKMLVVPPQKDECGLFNNDTGSSY